MISWRLRLSPGLFSWVRSEAKAEASVVSASQRLSSWALCVRSVFSNTTVFSAVLSAPTAAADAKTLSPFMIETLPKGDARTATVVPSLS
jgi:hypothetical protein